MQVIAIDGGNYAQTATQPIFENEANPKKTILFLAENGTNDRGYVGNRFNQSYREGGSLLIP